jgi:hypothetical protein
MGVFGLSFGTFSLLRGASTSPLVGSTTRREQSVHFRLRGRANREVPSEGWQLSRCPTGFVALVAPGSELWQGSYSCSKCGEARRKGGYTDGRGCRQFR